MRHRRKPAFLDNAGKPIAFAHRGGNAAGPRKENTMPAFEAAYNLGYRYFETDVVLSADGKVVAIHGSKTDDEARDSGVPLRSVLEATHYDDIKRFFKIDGEEIPLLAEVMDAFPDVRFNIDAKTKRVVRPLGRLLLDFDPDRVCIGAFKYKRTKRVVEEHGGQLCTSLGPIGFVALKTRLLPGYLENTDADCLQIPYKWTSSAMIRRAHAANLDVHLWTVNQEADMQAGLANGADGIITDEVAVLRSVMEQTGTWRQAA